MENLYAKLQILASAVNKEYIIKYINMEDCANRVGRNTPRISMYLHGKNLEQGREGARVTDQGAGMKWPVWWVWRCPFCLPAQTKFLTGGPVSRELCALWEIDEAGRGCREADRHR